MRTPTSLPDGTLTWVRLERFKRRYRLYAGDTQVGSLDWETTFGSTAAGVVQDERWTFTRRGILRPVVTAQTLDGLITAQFQTNWKGGGTLECGTGRQFRWETINRWQTRWGWKDSAGNVRVTLKGKQVEIERTGKALPELGLLVLLTQYLAVTLPRD